MTENDSDRHATLEDVAQAAGVSRMTVSRVLNGRGGASEKTTRYILDLAKKMDYRPNTVARSLRSRKSGVIGVVVPDIGNPFFPEIFRGAESLALPNGYTLMLSNVVESADREAEVLEKLLSQQVDGIIWCSARMDEDHLIKALAPARAAVLVNRRCPPEYASSVNVDYALGARMAMRHLSAIGAATVGIAAGPEWSFAARERLEGVHDAVEQSGLRTVATVHCDPTIQGGQQAAGTLLHDHTGIDALLCYNDLTAVGALRVCVDYGIKVPGDLAVIGFDDIDIASLVSPSITSLGVERYELGRAAMRLLLKRINREEVENLILQPRLTVRGSTVAAAG